MENKNSIQIKLYQPKVLQGQKSVKNEKAKKFQQDFNLDLGLDHQETLDMSSMIHGISELLKDQITGQKVDLIKKKHKEDNKLVEKYSKKENQFPLTFFYDCGKIKNGLGDTFEGCWQNHKVEGKGRLVLKELD